MRFFRCSLKGPVSLLTSGRARGSPWQLSKTACSFRTQSNKDRSFFVFGWCFFCFWWFAAVFGQFGPQIRPQDPQKPLTASVGTVEERSFASGLHFLFSPTNAIRAAKTSPGAREAGPRAVFCSGRCVCGRKQKM